MKTFEFTTTAHAGAYCKYLSVKQKEGLFVMSIKLYLTFYFVYCLSNFGLH